MWVPRVLTWMNVSATSSYSYLCWFDEFVLRLIWVWGSLQQLYLSRKFWIMLVWRVLTSKNISLRSRPSNVLSEKFWFMYAEESVIRSRFSRTNIRGADVLSAIICATSCIHTCDIISYFNHVWCRKYHVIFYHLQMSYYILSHDKIVGLFCRIIGLFCRIIGLF